MATAILTRELTHWNPVRQILKPGRDAAHLNDPFRAWRNAMSLGDFERAWTINNAHGQHWPSAHQLWNGSALAGKDVELQARHGLGDFVQMMRFVPLLNRLNCDVSLNIDPKLRSFASCFKGDFRFKRASEPTSANVLEMMELPYALRLQRNQLPCASTYLSVPENLRIATTRTYRRARPQQIGLVWTGSAWDPERWIPLSAFLPLFQMRQFTWWSLQGGDARQQSRQFGLEDKCRSNDGELPQLAAHIQQMDLLITVDTLAAHIAGAMGKEVWVLLKENADWRWMERRKDSPWYPSARLFRQRNGDWQTVISDLKMALQDRLRM